MPAAGSVGEPYRSHVNAEQRGVPQNGFAKEEFFVQLPETVGVKLELLHKGDIVRIHEIGLVA